MIAKKNIYDSKNLSTLEFQNMNIHNINNTKLAQFKGYAFQDTKNLDMKKKVIYDGIYCQPTNMNNNLLPKKNNDICEQVIDFGDFQSAFNTNTNNDTQSDLTLNTNSISKVNQTDSNQSSYSSSEESNSCNQQNNYNAIIQDIIENESQNEIDMIQDTYSITNTNNEEIESNIINNSDILFALLQESIIFQNKTHFLKMKDLQQREIRNTVCDEDYKDCLKLINIFMQYNIPLNKIYTDTMAWKYNHNKLTTSSMNIASLVKKSEAIVYGSSIATKIRPTQTNIICPSGRHVTITSFDIDALILDILTDNDLIQFKNLLFEDGDINNPFTIKENHTYNDFHTSEFYLETMKKKNINQETDLLVPIQLYMDETVLDSYGKLSFHPLVMTLMIFNRSTRN